MIGKISWGRTWGINCKLCLVKVEGLAASCLPRLRIFGNGLELGFGFGLACFEFLALGRLAANHFATLF